MSDLKQKFLSSSKNQKVQILTLVPVEKTAQEFCTSKHSVKMARKLKNERGILAEPSPKCGKPLPEAAKQKVRSFFTDEEFTRCCPGKKDCVTVKVDGKRVKQQKQLLLCNLKELLLEFVKRNPNMSIGFSTFCVLRPPWCITVSSSGTHSVCVCVNHTRM